MRSSSSFSTLMLLLAIVLAATGCDGGIRVSKEQADELSQANADIDAARSLAQEDAEAGYKLMLAAMARTKAAVADLALPEPATPAATFIAPETRAPAIADESKASAAAEANPPAGVAARILTGLAGAALLTLGVLRMSPGAFGLAMDLLYKIAAPLVAKQARNTEKKAVTIAELAVEYGVAVTKTAIDAGLGASVEQIQRAAAADQAACGVRDETKAILAVAKKAAG